MPLTDTAIRAFKPGDKQIKLFDGGGLFLLVTPNAKKGWRLKYCFEGKEKLLSMGIYPDVSLAKACKKRDEARTLLADGIDPGENRKAVKASKNDRAANSFEVVAREWFAKFAPTWATSYADKVIRRLERDIFPWLGGRPVSDVTPPELLTALPVSKNVARARRHAGHGLTVGRYFAMPSRPGALSVTRPLICAAR